MNQIKKFKLKNQRNLTKQEKTQIPLFTVIPASEKAKDYILQQGKTIDNLNEIIEKLSKENEELKKRLSKYEAVE